LQAGTCGEPCGAGVSGTGLGVRNWHGLCPYLEGHLSGLGPPDLLTLYRECRRLAFHLPFPLTWSTRARPSPPLPTSGSFRTVWFELLNPPISAFPEGPEAGPQRPGAGSQARPPAAWPWVGYKRKLVGPPPSFCFSPGLLGSLLVGDLCCRPSSCFSAAEILKPPTW
jgi:hypothetical protein